MTAIALNIAAWILGSGFTTELLGYALHRLLHSGVIGFLSRNHMKHHLLLYGPVQEQRSQHYHDATAESASLGNIGIEWLIPAAMLIACALALFHVFHVRLLYQLIFLATSLTWSFLMFSYLHDVMHVEGFWLEKNRWLKKWFTAARKLHDIHHEVINHEGLMDKNFGIGFFVFDRLFGTLAAQESAFNPEGYQAAQERFKSILS
jgi:sterol desaturase/sphingolipid hydroxylase (fatty acid hydroxylase superfamily)